MNINATLLGQMISFAIFTWFCLKYVWPPIIKAMEERQNKLAAGLQDAEKAQEALKNAELGADERLKEAKDQAAALIEQANKRASQIIEEAKDQAKAEGNRLKAQAETEIEQEINRAKEQLRSEVSGLIIAGAEKVLGSAVDQNAHKGILDKLATELK